MKTKIFVINGQGGVGKDSFVNFICDYDKKITGEDRIIHTTLIERVKEIAKKCGWHGEKTPQARAFLHDLTVLLEKYNDLPYQSIVQTIRMNELVCNNNKIPIKPFLFVDIREPKDIERFKKDFECTTILIKRGESKNYGNAADDDVFNYQYDFVIENNRTLEDLKDAAESFWLYFLFEQSHFEWDDTLTMISPIDFLSEM